MTSNTDNTADPVSRAAAFAALHVRELAVELRAHRDSKSAGHPASGRMAELAVICRDVNPHASAAAQAVSFARDAVLNAVVDARPPAAFVPVHPVHGPLWANTTNDPSPERLPSYPLMALYASPMLTLGAPREAASREGGV